MHPALQSCITHLCPVHLLFAVVLQPSPLASPKSVGNYRAKIYIGIKYRLEGSPIHHHIHKRTHRLTGEKGENDGDSGLDVIV